MRCVMQRVRAARVTADGTISGEIGRGLLVFLGVSRDDTSDDLDWITGKILQVRVFPDESGKMNRSVLDISGEVMVISQFTLFGNLKKGTRPSYNRAADPAGAQALYEAAVEKLKAALPSPVATGVFGAHMDIEAVQDGPVTLTLDSRDRDF